MSKARDKICLVTTSFLVIKSFLIPQILELSKKYDVTIVCDFEELELVSHLNLPVRIINIPIKRKINLIADFKALFHLLLFFIKEGFDVVHSVAPKAGLLAMVAASMSRVPSRVHVFQGEIWQTKKGLFRLLLKNIDRVISFCSTHLIVVSESERQFLIGERIISAKKSKVLGSGSICGVDIDRFKPNPAQRNGIRKSLDIAETDTILLFVGRLNRDKGLLELVEAFNMILKSVGTKCHLFIVGPDEENIISSLDLASKTNIHLFSYTDHPEHYMAASDILVLPSHREGFGLVIIEAAAVGIPSVGSDIVGIRDAIVDNVTGLLVKVNDASDLHSKILTLLLDERLRHRMGQQAQSRCKDRFLQQNVINSTMEFYQNDLGCNP